jgi:proline iminopeptidase
MHARELAMPIDERLVRSDDAELFVRRAGGQGAQADALVAVHGGPGISHELLQPLEALATPTFSVVNSDQRGVGRSSGRVDESRVFDQALADLDAVAADVARVHVLGHSWGGILAALYAATRPGRVASLTLVDSIPPTSAALAEAMGRMRARVGQFQARGLVPADLPSWDEDGTALLLALLPIYFTDPRHPGARSLGGARVSAAANRASGVALSSYDVRDALARITAPTLCFIAPVPFGPEMGTAMADAIPGAARVFLDCGHLPWIERPAPFLGRLASFITQTVETQTKGQKP